MCPRMGGYVPTDHKTRHQDGGRDEISIADLSGTPAALTTHEADLDAHILSLFEQVKVGNYLIPFYSGARTNITLTQYRLYALYLVLPRAMTFDRLGIQVTTLESGKKARLGIYNCDADLLPSSLVLDAGTVDIDGTGLKAATISQSLAKGRYFLAVISDATGTAVVRSIANYIGGLGAESDLSICETGYVKTQTSAEFDALPATFPSGPTASASLVTLGLRLESLG